MKLATKFRHAMLAILQTREVSTPASPYHPAYGLADTTRKRAVRIAKEHGVKAAIAECNVSQASVYRWLSAYSNFANNT